MSGMVYDLNLSVRAFNCVTRFGINTIDELEERIDEFCKHAPNFGKEARAMLEIWRMNNPKEVNEMENTEHPNSKSRSRSLKTVPVILTRILHALRSLQNNSCSQKAKLQGSKKKKSHLPLRPLLIRRLYSRLIWLLFSLRSTMSQSSSKNTVTTLQKTNSSVCSRKLKAKSTG